MSKNKDIYAHIAEVYLDSSRNNKKAKSYPSPLFKNLFKLNIAIIACLFIVLMITIFSKRSIPKSQVALILENSTTKINYDFNQIKKEAAVFDLRNINLLDFKTLNFRARKSNYQDELHMGIEFISQFGEKSRFYIKQIPTKWKDFRIDLEQFKDISDWSRMRQLLFVLEEWNAQTKKGVVYIDNIYVLK